MNKRNASLFMAGLLLMTAQIASAQQPSNNDARNDPAEMKCRTPVTVKGAVTVPIQAELRRRARLNELLTQAGGLTERATGKIEITRVMLDSDCKQLAPNDQNKKTESVEIYDFAELLSGNEKANPYLQPGDTINVLEAGVIWVTGSVMNPRGLVLHLPYTVTTSIEAAGGLRRDALGDRVNIYRLSPTSDELAVIKVNLKAIKKRRAEDIVLQSDDIVEVLDNHGGDRIPSVRRLKLESVGDTYRIIY